MGKPSSSCLKIIACGSDSAVEDEAPEAKGSGEKRGWSFRKKSTRHRVLSSSVTSENLTLGSKETSQSTTIESQTPAGPAISEKVLALEQPDEKSQLPASFELKPPKSIEPKLSETLDAPEPTKLLDTEVSGTLHPPEQPELFEPEEPERVHASESPELVEPEKCVSVGDSKSLNLVEQEVHESCETVAASALEPSEQVEPKTSVPVGESESLNLEAEGPEMVVVSALEPPQPVESEMFEEVVAESLAITELKQLDTVASSQDDIVEEPIVVIIQTGVRGYLAQKELAKVRSTVKLQAAIRGHLVRRQAVDTLYCMQGIVKVQSLVRARHSLRLGNDVSVNKPTTTESSTEKLLRSAFARQLLESTPKSKSTICDPLKPNPAWTWLERWMAVSSSGLAESKTPEVIAEDVQFKEEEISPIMECGNLSEVIPESINPEFAVKESYETFENEKVSISSDPAEEYQPSSLLSSEEKMEQPYDSTNASLVEPLEVAAPNDQSIQSDPHPQTQSGTLSNNLVVQIEEPKLSAKRMASEQVDVENTKFAYGSRKASSPAFIAAQSKFEELSSSASTASLKSPRQDAIEESHPNTESSLEESVLKEKEPSISEASIPDEARVNMGGSECGTELSVTSALDSPDRFEAHVAEMDLEVKYVKEEAGSPISSETLEVKANGHSSVYDSNSSASALVQEEFLESNGVPKPVVAADANQPEQKPEAVASEERDNGEYVVLDMAAGSPHLEHKLESGASDSQGDVGSQVEQQAYKLSPEATPDSSRVTVAESQGTPSSQVSVKTKRSKVDKSKSSTKHSSHSGGKKTAAKPLLDSGVRSSGEQLSKDQKSGKRRSSFGSAKSDNIDQEPRDSTSSIKALPSYMQATESAKAKSHSPRSSPDVQDKDAHIIKKRHSLPGALGRQGSPRVQRPTAQSPQPQAVKGNANTPPQERKWLR